MFYFKCFIFFVTLSLFFCCFFKPGKITAGVCLDFVPVIGEPLVQHLTIQGFEYHYPITKDILGTTYDLMHETNLHNHPSEFSVPRAAAQYEGITVAPVNHPNGQTKKSYKWNIKGAENMIWFMSNQFMPPFARSGTAPPTVNTRCFNIDY